MHPIIVEEWIGRRVRIVSAPHPAHIGLEGVVVDETQRTLLLKGADGRERQIPKAGARLSFIDEKPPVEIDASICAVRPEERTKKLYKKIKG